MIAVFMVAGFAAHPHMPEDKVNLTETATTEAGGAE
jgi:hypothetical protein